MVWLGMQHVVVIVLVPRLNQILLIDDQMIPF